MPNEPPIQRAKPREDADGIGDDFLEKHFSLLSKQTVAEKDASKPYPFGGVVKMLNKLSHN